MLKFYTTSNNQPDGEITQCGIEKFWSDAPNEFGEITIGFECPADREIQLIDGKYQIVQI